jgi:mono/diheme cytochrome c family protein
MIKKILRDSLFILLFISCGHDFNSNDLDKLRFGDKSVEGSALFKASFEIMNNRCVSCHTNRHANYASLKTESDWIRESLVIPRNPIDSQIMQRLINNGGDMPQGGSALSAQEIQTLTDWINSL